MKCEDQFNVCKNVYKRIPKLLDHQTFKLSNLWINELGVPTKPKMTQLGNSTDIGLCL